MESLITTNHVRERLVNFTRENYIFVYGMMKSIALGVGTIVLFEIIRAEIEVPKLLFWIASLFSIIVSYSTMTRGVLLTGWRYNWLDNMIPFVMGIIECMMFIVLQQNAMTPSTSWHVWPVVCSIQLFTAFALVANRRNQIHDSDFEETLIPIAGKLRMWLAMDMVGIGITGSIMFVLALFILLLSEDAAFIRSWLLLSAGALMVIVPLVVTIRTENQRREIVQEVVINGQ